MTPVPTPRCDRTIAKTLGILEQQAREYAHCRARGDTAGALLASIHMHNAVAFLHAEAVEDEAAQARAEGVRP